MTLQEPPFLQTGDTVAIVSSARKVDKEVVDQAINLLNSRGYKVECGRHLLSEHHQFAGTDAQRTKDLQWAIDSNHIKAVFFVRGGYGSVRIIDYIDWEPFVKNPKWLIGYSDITAIHSVLNRLKVCSLHATMPINFSNNTPEALDSLFNILKGEKPAVIWKIQDAHRNVELEGEMVGGNLSMLYSLMGSKDQLKTQGKILFLEDLDEHLYHIDRMMQCLKRAGMLKDLKALLVGGFTDLKDNSTPFGQEAHEIIQSTVSDYQCPIVFDLPVGHIDDNRALVSGGHYKLKINQGVSSLLLCNAINNR